MVKLSLSDGLAVAAVVLTLVLLVLDKAGKLKGLMLLILLALAALLTVPLALNNPWVREAVGMLRFSRGILMVFAVGLVYSGIAVWVSTGSTDEKSPAQDAATKPIESPPQKAEPPTKTPQFESAAGGAAAEPVPHGKVTPKTGMKPSAPAIQQTVPTFYVRASFDLWSHEPGASPTERIVVGVKYIGPTAVSLDPWVYVVMTNKAGTYSREVRTFFRTNLSSPDDSPRPPVAPTLTTGQEAEAQTADISMAGSFSSVDRLIVRFKLLADGEYAATIFEEVVAGGRAAGNFSGWGGEAVATPSAQNTDSTKPSDTRSSAPSAAPSPSKNTVVPPVRVTASVIDANGREVRNPSSIIFYQPISLDGLRLFSPRRFPTFSPSTTLLKPGTYMFWASKDITPNAGIITEGVQVAIEGIETHVSIPLKQP
jgi:hypothetical protein